MNNLQYYRENILHKVEIDKKLDEIMEFLSTYYADNVEIRIGKNKMITDREMLLNLCSKIKEDNNKKIDKYLNLSFGDCNCPNCGNNNPSESEPDKEPTEDNKEPEEGEENKKPTEGETPSEGSDENDGQQPTE